MTSAPAIKLLIRKLLAADSPAERFRAGRELARTIRRLPRPKQADLEEHFRDLLGSGMLGTGGGSLFSGSFLNPAGGLLADLVSRAGSGEGIEWRRAADELIDRVLAEEEPSAPPPPAPEDPVPTEDLRAAADGRGAGDSEAGRLPNSGSDEGAAETDGPSAGANTSGARTPSTQEAEEGSAGTGSAAAAPNAPESCEPEGTEGSPEIEDSVEMESEPPRSAGPKLSFAARAAVGGAPFSVTFVNRDGGALGAPSAAASGDEDESMAVPRTETGSTFAADPVTTGCVDASAAGGVNSVPLRDGESIPPRHGESILPRGGDSSAARGGDSSAARGGDSSAAAGGESISARGGGSHSADEAGPRSSDRTEPTPARGGTRTSEGGADSLAAGSTVSNLPSGAGSGRHRDAGRSPTAGIRRFVSGASRWDEATRRREIAALPEWAARRALCAAIRSAALTVPEEIIELIAALASPAARLWCLGELLAAHGLDGALLDRALELASPSARRRLLARRSRNRASHISAC